MEIIRPKQLAEKLGLTERTIRRWRRAGKLPEPRKISVRAIGWRREDLEDWWDSLPVADGSEDSSGGDHNG